MRDAALSRQPSLCAGSTCGADDVVRGLSLFLRGEVGPGMTGSGDAFGEMAARPRWGIQFADAADIEVESVSAMRKDEGERTMVECGP